jgi:hypothetical protein
MPQLIKPWLEDKPDTGCQILYKKTDIISLYTVAIIHQHLTVVANRLLMVEQSFFVKEISSSRFLPMKLYLLRHCERREAIRHTYRRLLRRPDNYRDPRNWE